MKHTRASSQKSSPHPGAYVRATVLAPLGLLVKDAAAAVGVGRPAMSNFLNGHAALSGDMAVRLEKAFGVPVDTLMHMQAEYDIAQARQREKSIRVNRYQPTAALEADL